MKKLFTSITLLLALFISSPAWAENGILTGEGTSANPYIISDLADWNTFADWLNNGATAADYVDKYFKLAADIGTTANPVTTTASEYYSNPFRGNFNGNGHTITVAFTRTTNPEGDEHAQGLALFHYAGDGCNIHDLHVTGTLETCGKFAAGFIAFISNGVSSDNRKIVSINRCRSSVTITSTVEGDATSAGFVGASKKHVNLTLNNCRFDGAFVSSTATQFSGMVGWQDGSGYANILNSLVMPGAGMSLTAPDGNHYTFCRYGGESFGMINSYYSTAIGTEQGNAVGDMGTEDLKNALGAAWLVQEGEALPYAISYHYTLIDHCTATEAYIPRNIIPDHGNFGYAKLVDGDKGTYWEAWPVDWTNIYVNFQSDAPFVLKGYVVTVAPDIQDNPRHNPAEWYLRGKNANGEWEEIDHRGGWQYEGGYAFYCDENLPAINSAEKVYVLTDNTNTYQQFQFEVIRVVGWDNQSNMRLQVGELQLFGLLNNNDLSNACISGVNDIYMWNNGNPIEVNSVVTDYNGNVLTKGTDYNQNIKNDNDETMSEITDAGHYTLTIIGTGNENYGYFGTKSIDFTVTDHPTGLSVDHSIPEGTLGRYYINLQKNQQTIIDLNTMTPPFTTPFKVYDDGGKNRNFTMGCSEDLMVVAPEDYVIQVSGTIDLGDETLLEFYDGTWGENLMAGNFNRCIGDNIGSLITTGPQLAIKYNTSTDEKRAGLNLTVIPVPANTSSAITFGTYENGSVTASVNNSQATTATVNDLVTLTATPNAGYLPNDFTATDALGNTVVVAGGWFTGNTATFTMPGSDVTVTPHFVSTAVTGSDPIELSVNIPRVSNGPADALVATIPDGVECFKIYDNGGPDNNYSYSSDGYLLLVAPENKVIQLTAVTMHNIHATDNLEVFDGNTTDYPLGGPYSYDDDMGTLTSTGNQMLIHFTCNYTNYSTYSGLDLLARVYDTSDEFAITVTPTEYGTVAVDPASGAATVSSTVTLTFTPNEGYTGYRAMDFVTNYPSVLVEGGWYSDNVMTFPMPAGPVNVTPNFTSATTAEDGLYVNMPRKNTYATSRRVNIPIGVSSFKVYDDGGPDGIYSDFCDGYMILTAPEGKRIKLTGILQCAPNNDFLDIFDGNTTDELIGSYSYGAFDQYLDLGTIYSSGQSLLLHFYSNTWNQFSLEEGFDIKIETVSLPSPYLTFCGFTATAGQNGYDPSPDNESWPNLVDNTLNTVWRTYNDTGVGFRTCFAEFNHTEPIVPKKYILVTGNQTKQHPGRLPKSWTLKGKLNPDDEWTTITTVEDDQHLLPINYYEVEYSLEENHQAFQYFRFEISDVQGHEPGTSMWWDNYIMELDELYFKGYKASEVQNDLTFATISGVEPRYVYTGSTIDVDYTVTDVNGETLTNGTDYLGAIEPMPVLAAGDYRLTISAKEGSGFTGNQSLSFKVTDYPENVDIDDDYESPDQLGYYYVNMPKTGTKTVDLGHPAGFHKSVKIYDDGGKSGKYSDWCDGKLLLQAPEGYVLQLNGTVTSETNNDYLTIYDGSETNANILGKDHFGNEDGEDIGNLTTSGQYLLLYFTSSSSSTRSGIDLTMSMISTTEARGISFEYNAGGSGTASPNPANIGSIVTLTPNPNPGYLVYDFIAKDTYNYDVDVTASWYDNGSFIMPGSEVTVTPVSTHRLSYLGGLYIDMAWNETKTVDIPQGVSSFKVYDNGGKDGDYHGPCNDILILNAPEGYVLRIEGEGGFNYIGAPQSFNVFDGNTLMQNYVGGNHVNIGPLTTESNQMQLLFSNCDDGGYGLDLTVTVYKPNCWTAGNGTANSPYEISNIDGLELLATLSEANTFEGLYFKLTADIATEGRPFRKMIGDNVDYPFCGHLDGDGHTITVALSNGNPYSGDDEAEGGLALFHYVGNGCELMNLTVTGTVKTANKFAAGFIAYVKPGDSQNIKSYTLTNCRSSVAITSTHAGDNTIGGFIGLSKEYTHPVLSNCVFDGSFTSVDGTRFSGMVGYMSGHTTIDFTNSVVAADASGLGIKNGDHYTFFRAHDSNSSGLFTNNYYHTALGTAQGTKAYRLHLPIGVTAIRNNAIAIGNNTSALYADGFNVNEQPYYTSYTSGPTVTLGPKTNFVIHSATVSYDNNSWQANPNGDGTFWFNMPASDATVTAAMDLQFTVEGYGEGAGNWVFLATPTVEDITPSLDNHFLVVPSSDYDLYRFNQSADLEWENFKVHYNDGTFRTLTNGRGYLYARKETYTLTFSSPFNWGISQAIDLDYDENAQLKGWNLVGNPFPVKAYADRPYLRLNANGDEVEIVPDYATTPIPACTGIMVQADGENETVTFTSTPKYQSQSNHGRLVVEVAKSKTGSVVDKAVVSFNEDEQLRKYVFDESNTLLYFILDSTDYAMAYNNNSDFMQIGFKPAKDGAYTFNFALANAELEFLHLIDNKAGLDIDLLTTPEYHFDATTTDHEARFYLIFNMTDVPEITDTPVQNFAYIYNGEIILTGVDACDASLQVIDMMGRVLLTRTVTPNSSLLTPNSPGVYVLRLITGDNIKTQKIVIE